MATIKMEATFDPYYLDDGLKKRLSEAVAKTLWEYSGIRNTTVTVEYEIPEYEQDGRDDA